MASKFEKLIEYVIANDEKNARSVLHQIVVDKSRKIWEDMELDDPARAFDDVEADHTAASETETLGGDEADDLQTDTFVDDNEQEGGKPEDEVNPEVDDRISDLESNYEELDAEFEDLKKELDKVQGEGSEEEEVPDEEISNEEESEDEFPAVEHESDEDEKPPVDESLINEYILRVSAGLANDKEEGFVNKNSALKAKPSLVPSVSAKNLNQGGVSQGRPNPQAKEMIGDAEVVNRPGRKSATLKGAPKPVIDKEDASVNKQSVEA
ncbi:Uncharacterised protein [uncultured archaeon]|nr:Uncharacterised protein [uncultured archaeon]